MKNISKRDPIASLNENFLIRLQDVLVENLHVGREEIPTIEACLEAFVRHEEKMQTMISSNVNLENFKKIHEVMKQMWVKKWRNFTLNWHFIQLFSSNQSDLLREFIFSGPTSRPTLQDPKHMLNIHERELKKIEIEKEFEHIKENYKKNIVEPWDSDRFYRMEKKLWIYFLTEPRKVLECIREVQARAAQKGCSEYKALNIQGCSKNYWKLWNLYKKFSKSKGGKIRY